MGRGGRSSRKQLFAEWNQHTTAPAGQETEVPNADEATRQHMQQKATQELIDSSVRRRFLFLCAESRQRNVTVSSRKETRR